MWPSILPNPFRKSLAALGATALLALPAAGTTLARMSLGQLTHAATAVVRARCLGAESQWQGGEIWTVSRFQTIETFKGHPPARFTVRLLGGRVGGIVSLVDGVPRFLTGERVVLFLDPLPRGGYSVAAWSEGTFRVRKDRITGRKYLTQDTAAQTLYDPTTRTFRSEGVRRMPLGTFRLLMRKFTRGRPRLAPGTGAAGTGGGER